MTSLLGRLHGRLKEALLEHVLYRNSFSFGKQVSLERELVKGQVLIVSTITHTPVETRRIHRNTFFEKLVDLLQEKSATFLLVSVKRLISIEYSTESKRRHSLTFLSSHLQTFSADETATRTAKHRRNTLNSW